MLPTFRKTSSQEVRGKGVLELGCGVGLPGVAAAIAGAEQVILTDMVGKKARACGGPIPPSFVVRFVFRVTPVLLPLRRREGDDG